MDLQAHLERLAQAKFLAWNDYCDTGEDKPSWNEWLEQMKTIITKPRKRSVISLSVRAIYGR